MIDHNVEQTIKERAAKCNAVVALADVSDNRVREAASIIESQRIARTLLVDEHTLIDEELLIQHLLHRRSAKGLSYEQAQGLARQPLFRAAWLVHTGVADAAVAGSLSTTPDVLRAALWTLGTSSDISIVSSFFLMVLKDGTPLTYADCGVVPNPTSSDLVSIAKAAADSHRQLTQTEPRVAFLSFSTKGSANHPDVHKVREAYAMFQHRYPTIVSDGELQFDAAYVPSVAQRKAPNSPLAGRANVFIFPTLDAGNIAYKLTERLGEARAYGPITQGLQKPFVDLSRGCSANDIVMAAAIAVLQSLH